MVSSASVLRQKLAYKSGEPFKVLLDREPSSVDGI
jgi:hypothetical protein